MNLVFLNFILWNAESFIMQPSNSTENKSWLQALKFNPSNLQLTNRALFHTVLAMTARVRSQPSKRQSLNLLPDNTALMKVQPVKMLPSYSTSDKGRNVKSTFLKTLSSAIALFFPGNNDLHDQPGRNHPVDDVPQQPAHPKFVKGLEQQGQGHKNQYP